MSPILMSPSRKVRASSCASSRLMTSMLPGIADAVGGFSKLIS
jgi:hypothetical protein